MDVESRRSLSVSAGRLAAGSVAADMERGGESREEPMKRVSILAIFLVVLAASGCNAATALEPTAAPPTAAPTETAAPTATPVPTPTATPAPASSSSSSGSPLDALRSLVGGWGGL